MPTGVRALKGHRHRRLPFHGSPLKARKDRVNLGGLEELVALALDIDVINRREW